MRYRSILILVVAALAVGAVAGCGGDDDGDEDGAATAADTGTAAAAAASAVTINMSDFFFDPKDATAEAGSVTISAPNDGKTKHELVLFKTDDDPASLPLAGGEVDEEAMEKQGAELVGEIEDVEPGQTKDASFDLTPGEYVMFCNLPAHYEQGMYGSFTVK